MYIPFPNCVREAPRYAITQVQTCYFWLQRCLESAPCRNSAFLKKGKHIAALERSDAEKATQLTEDGWEKQVEEVRAADAENVIARLAEMRKEDASTERALVTG